MTADIDPEKDLVLERLLKAPRALVWECWTTPEHIVHFFIPKPHKVTACEIDLTVGGRFNSTFEIEGREVANQGVFLEIVPRKKLVFTDTYCEGWKPAPDPFMTAILLLADAPGGGTKYTAIARHRSTDARKTHEDMGFHDGWATVADQLEAYALDLNRL